MGVRKYGLVAASDVKVRDPNNPENQANVSAASHMMANATYHPIGGNPMPHLIRPGAQWESLRRPGRDALKLTGKLAKQEWKRRQGVKAEARTEAMGSHPAAQNMYNSPVFGAAAASTVGTPGSYFDPPGPMGARRPMAGAQPSDAPEVTTVNSLTPEDMLYTAPKMMGAQTPASRMAKFAQGRGLGL